MSPITAGEFQGGGSSGGGGGGSGITSVEPDSTNTITVTNPSGPDVELGVTPGTFVPVDEAETLVSLAAYAVSDVKTVNPAAIGFTTAAVPPIIPVAGRWVGSLGKIGYYLMSALGSVGPKTPITGGSDINGLPGSITIAQSSALGYTNGAAQALANAPGNWVESADGTTGYLGNWYSSGNFEIELTFANAGIYIVSFYAIDPNANRVEHVSDGTTTVTFNGGTAFPGGYTVQLTETVTANQTVTFTVSGGPTPVINAVFIDPGPVATSANVLSSYAPTFSSGDVGKTVVVGAAGAPCASTLSVATGTSPITTLSCAALPIAMPGGGVIVGTTGHTQTFFTTGAAAGATSIPIVGISGYTSTPTFNFPIGSTVTAYNTPPLKSTIASFTDSTTVVLAANASTTGQVEAVYGTNNFTAIQNAINAAVAQKLPLYIPPVTEGWGYDGTLVLSADLRIKGDGAFDLGGSNYILNGDAAGASEVPLDAPYLRGSVLVCFALGVDAFQLNGTSQSLPWERWGIRFAGKYVNTGHGINNQPPLYSGTQQDAGVVNSEWDDIKVFGVDGNHYGLVLVNSQLNTNIQFRSWGGGAISYDGNGAVPAGNNVFIHPYGCIVAGGTANGYNFVGADEYSVMLRPQSYASVIPGGLFPPCAYQIAGTFTSNAPVIIAPDFEGGSTGVAGAASGGLLIGAGAGTTPSTPTTSAGVEQTQVEAFCSWVFVMTPSAIAAASVELLIGPSSTPTAVAAYEVAPANTGPFTRTVSATIPAGWYYTFVLANAAVSGTPYGVSTT